MQNFIVLGYVPGTQIQINFYSWLLCFVVFAAILIWLFGRKIIQQWLLGWRVAHIINATAFSLPVLE